MWQQLAQRLRIRCVICHRVSRKSITERPVHFVKCKDLSAQEMPFQRSHNFPW